MRQSSTLAIGMDVHKASIAVADVAQDHDADVIYLGTIGTRHVDIDQFIRKFQSRAKPLICVYEAGPCGYWLSRYVTKKGDDCWVVAPSLIPQAGRRPRQNRPPRRRATGPVDALGGFDPRLCPIGGPMGRET
jgi:transposase